MTHTMTFRGHPFSVVEGTVHPAYSLACFSPEGEASYGAYALAAAACGAHVMAFEPEPSVFVDLERNAKLNDFSIECYPFALSSGPQTIDMREFAPHWPQQTISGPYEATALDRFDLQRLDWCKIDVEGHEVEVLRGAAETLKRCKPVVIVEVHVFIDPGLATQCNALLAEAGYGRIEVIRRDPCVMMIGRP
jgi:FkbM family methyltransferase